MSNNLDLEIKQALEDKIDLDKFMLFTVNVTQEMEIDFRINKNTNQLTVIARYEQTPHCIQHTYKNVTMTYYTWNDERCEDVTDEIVIQYKVERTINNNDEFTPIIKEMIQEIMDAKNKFHNS